MHRPGPGLRQRRGRVRGGQDWRIRPATWPSSATKGRAADPGMREMLGGHRGDHGCGPRRFRGADHRWPFLRRDARPDGGHVAPEAARGGPIAAVQDGDIITIDIPGRTLTLDINAVGAGGPAGGTATAAGAGDTGVMGKYARLVSSAAQGAVTGMTATLGVQQPMKRTGAQILWECLVREGVDDGVRLSGRGDSAGLRRDARLSDPPRARAPRTGRHAHGRRLRARERQGRRRDRDLRARARPTWSPASPPR